MNIVVVIIIVTATKVMTTNDFRVANHTYSTTKEWMRPKSARGTHVVKSGRAEDVRGGDLNARSGGCMCVWIKAAIVGMSMRRLADTHIPKTAA